MNRFHFPLERVLDWRRKQLDLEEARFRQAVAATAALERTLVELEAGATRAESEVRGWDQVAGRDLRALADYQAHVRAEKTRLAAPRAECERAKAAQQTAMLEARRRCRLLERLRERRWAEWKAASDREMEEIASESYLAQWGNSQERAL